MSGLDGIAVRVETGSGNITPLLHEISHALQRLTEGGAGTIIDLGSLPLAPGEERRIEEFLGKGELRANLDALGPSVVQETRYAGVWFITHQNTEQEVVARFIEVTNMPELLLAQPDEVRRSALELGRRLNAADGESGPVD